MSILSIDHVQVAVPTGSEDRARAFYCGVLGFAEIDKPTQMAERKSIWFVAGTVNLHLGLESDFIPAKRAHPAFVVDRLDAILSACEHAGVVIRPDTSFNSFRRVHVFDPFGNRLELMERIPA
jgi:catechol 2,3-dioxygenase-like lactoylglutathione lyase family enzyme